MRSCDEIIIENLEVFANHGVLPEETRLGQKFLVSMRLHVEIGRASRRDEV